MIIKIIKDTFIDNADLLSGETYQVIPGVFQLRQVVERISYKLWVEDIDNLPIDTKTLDGSYYVITLRHDTQVDGVFLKKGVRYFYNNLPTGKKNLIAEQKIKSWKLALSSVPQDNYEVVV